MLVPSSGFRIFLYPHPINMSAGYDKLAYLASSKLGMNAHGGAVFLFFNRQRTRAKIFFYDGSGSCVFAKRLERGRFRVPTLVEGGGHATIGSSELGLLLEGADIEKIPRPRPWQSKQKQQSLDHRDNERNRQPDQ